MKNILPKFIVIIEVTFLVLIIFVLAKKFEYEFGLNLNLFSLIFSVFLFLFFLLETVENRERIRSIISNFVQKKKDKFYSNLLQNQKKIYAFLLIFFGGFKKEMAFEKSQKDICSHLLINKDVGKEISLVIAYLVTILGYCRYIFLKLFFSKYTFLILLILSIFIYYFVSNNYLVDLAIVFSLFAWILTVYKFNLKEEFSYMISLSFLINCIFLLLSKNDLQAEKSAFLLYFFSLAAIGQSLISSFKKE